MYLHLKCEHLFLHPNPPPTLLQNYFVEVRMCVLWQEVVLTDTVLNSAAPLGFQLLLTDYIYTHIICLISILLHLSSIFSASNSAKFLIDVSRSLIN